MPIDPLIQPKFLGTKAAFSTSDISKPKKASQTSGTTTPAPKTYQLSTFTPTKKMVKEADGYYRMHPLDGAKGKPAQSQSASIGSEVGPTVNVAGNRCSRRGHSTVS
jgi:hypothetical protein